MPESTARFLPHGVIYSQHDTLMNVELARGAVDFARQRGARALEGYPLITRPGTNVIWDELLVGSPNVFAAAGLTEVSHPTKRRLVMRIDFHESKSSKGAT